MTGPVSARYAGQVAVITGGYGGIGLAVAKIMVAEGANVVLTGPDRAKLDRAQATLPDDRCLTVESDVTRPEDNIRIAAAATERFGGIDVFIANAGISGPAIDLADLTVDQFDEVIAINVRGVFLGLRSMLPAIRRRGAGSVVIVSSIAGFKGRGTGNGAYVTSKHAVIGLMKTAAIENAPYGIRVNAVLPGPTDTAMIQGIAAAKSRALGGSGGKEAILRGMPLGRYGEADEVARLIAFIASREAGFCTGGLYAADGGLTAV